MTGNPNLIANAQADIAACQAEAPPRAAQGVPGEPCMRERGYYVRLVDETGRSRSEPWRGRPVTLGSTLIL